MHIHRHIQAIVVDDVTLQHQCINFLLADKLPYYTLSWPSTWSGSALGNIISKNSISKLMGSFTTPVVSVTVVNQNYVSFECYPQQVNNEV